MKRFGPKGTSLLFSLLEEEKNGVFLIDEVDDDLLALTEYAHQVYCMSICFVVSTAEEQQE